MKNLILNLRYGVFTRFLVFFIFYIKWPIKVIKNKIFMEDNSIISSSSFDIGHTIRSIRLKRKQSQLELAELSGVTQGFISYIEKGSKTPTLEILEKIAQSLNVPVYLLLFRAKSRRKNEFIAKNPKHAEFMSLVFENFDLVTDLFLSISHDEKNTEVLTSNINNQTSKTFDIEQLREEWTSLNNEVKIINNSLKKSLVGRKGELLSAS